MSHKSKTVKPKAAALILGADSHGLAVGRAIARMGVPVFALEPDQTRPGVASKYFKACWTIPSFSADDLVPSLHLARERLAAYEQVALLAVNDRHVEFIATHLPVLKPQFRVAWADTAELVLQLQKKDFLESYSRQRGLNYPRTAVLDGPADLGLIQGMQWPLIIKPARPLSSFKTLLASDAAAVEDIVRTHSQDMPVLVQEYIAGGDECLYFGALLLDKGRVVQRMAGRKIESYPPARGQTTIAQVVDEPAVLALTEQFFEGSAISGPVSLELKKDKAGRYWVIEPTVGRTDFWAELCISAGFNQPYLEYCIATGTPMATQTQSQLVPTVWYDAERDPTAYLRMCRLHRSFHPLLRGQAFPYFGHDDWQPLQRALLKLGSRQLRSRLGLARP